MFPSVYGRPMAVPRYTHAHTQIDTHAHTHTKTHTHTKAHTRPSAIPLVLALHLRDLSWLHMLCVSKVFSVVTLT